MILSDKIFQKGTLSYICKNINLPDNYISRQRELNKLRLVEYRKRALVANKRIQIKRLNDINSRALDVVNQKCDLNYQKISLAMLYKGEGSKYKGYRGLALSNSDPSVLKTYIALLKTCYDISHDQFRARIMYRADQDIVQILGYWSNELSIIPGNFYKSGFDKRTINKPTINVDYRGVCVISCKGADIQLELDRIATLYSEKIWGISSFG